jgi:hypothetical protein
MTKITKCEEGPFDYLIEKGRKIVQEYPDIDIEEYKKQNGCSAPIDIWNIIQHEERELVSGNGKSIIFTDILNLEF